MKFAYAIAIERPLASAWESLQDAPRLVRCLPGCESAEPVGAGELRVRLSTGLGPIRLHMEGQAKLKYDGERRALSADVSLSDGRAGAIYGTFVMQLQAVSPEQSAVQLEADVALGGKLGEFAQPLLRRKADQTVREFAENLKLYAG